MKFKFISALLSILLVVVVSGTKESKTNTIPPIAENKVQGTFGVKEFDDTTYTTPIAEDKVQVTFGIKEFDDTTYTTPITEDKESETNTIPPIAEDKVQGTFGIKEFDDTTYTTPIAEDKVQVTFGVKEFDDTTYTTPITEDKVKIIFGTKEFNNAINSIKLAITTTTSLFDAMKIAKKQDDTFRFTSRSHPKYGAYITSIGGLEEDLSKHDDGRVWMLYNCNNIIDPAEDIDLTGCILADKGVSSILPQNGDIWIFRYQYQNWTKKQL